MSRDPHIVVVGGNNRSRIAMVGLLKSAGFARVTSADSVVVPAEHLDDLGLILVVGPEVDVLCSQAREIPVLTNTPILAMVPAIPAGAGRSAIAAGANDVVYENPSAAVLGARVRNLASGIASRRRARELIAVQRTMMEVQATIAEGGDSPEALRDALVRAASTLEFDRASLIAHIEGSLSAYVIAATDDPTLSQFTLSMAKYPEVSAAIAGGKPLLIDDAQHHPVTANVAGKVREKGIRGMAIFPVVWRKRSLGVVMFRRTRPGAAHIGEGGRDFGLMFANQIAAQLGHGRVIESLREQTGRISRARYEAERRLRTIDSLKEHFEAQADGVVVLDEDGHILFVNHTAEDITGFARDGLIGSPLLDLVAPRQRDALRTIVSRVLSGTNVEVFDLDLSTTSGEDICVSVTTSTVLSSSRAVILSFRDVTNQRVLESELRKTKDFLERLIDSTVDAIVAADIRGNVILFNPGAERIYGHSAEEVIGRIPVWELYETGVASAVMRMLRSMSYGGVGRLEQTRREILTKSGELVPVNLTASIIYEDGREVASVGIFSDLRERIRIEQRLLQAQEKLQLTQKRALVAELAGAAAHELNQPLTSILGYAQLIQRTSQPDDRHQRGINVILSEGERMAKIVRKIGRITKFEIKEYVGSASILDLDKSAEATNPALVLPDADELAKLDEDRDLDDDTGRLPGIAARDGRDD